MSRDLLGRAREKIGRSSLLLTKGAMHTLRSLSKTGTTKQVTFVAGVQRSGTNMMMDVLERSYHTDVYHERDPRAYHDYEMKPRRVIRRLVEASNASHVIFKALCELPELRQLLDDFTPAKGIWVLRDFQDVVNSHVAIWNRMPRSIGEIVTDRNGAAGWRGRGMSDSTHALVTRLYHPEISNASACALFWYFRNVLFFEHALDSDERMYLVRYESLVKEPERECSRLFQFLGIEYSSWISSPVVLSSVSKRPAPEIEGRILKVCEGLTERFETAFAEMGTKGRG